MKPPFRRALTATALCVWAAFAGPETLSAQNPPKVSKPAKDSSPSPATPTGSGDPALAALEAQYAAERAADLLAALARYADELAALQKSLITSGDAAGAARVQLEIDRLQAVLGTAIPAGTDSDDTSIFDDPSAEPSPPFPRLDTATPADLESLLRALQPPASAGSKGPGQGTGGNGGSPDKTENSPSRAGKATKRLLKMAAAQLNGSYLPDAGHLYWSGTGQRATWTLSDLPTTSCLIVLRYACEEKLGGGKLSVRIGATKVEVDVPSTGGWTRFRDLTIGPLSISDSRADLVLEVASLNKDATSLMDLKAVMVIPSEP